MIEKAISGTQTIKHSQEKWVIKDDHLNKQVQNILHLERINSLKKKTAYRETAAVEKSDGLVLSGRAQE